MKTKENILNKAGILVVFVLLLFARFFAEWLQGPLVPGSMKSVVGQTCGHALIGGAIMLFVSVLAMCCYRSRFWERFDAKKILILLGMMVVLRYLVRNCITIPYMGTAPETSWLGMYEQTIFFPRSFLTFFEVNVMMPVLFLVYAKVFSKWEKRGFLVYVVLCILSAGVFYPFLWYVREWDTVEYVIAYISIFLVFQGCIYGFFYKEKKLDLKWYLASLGLTTCAMAGYLVYFAKENWSFFADTFYRICDSTGSKIIEGNAVDPFQVLMSMGAGWGLLYGLLVLVFAGMLIRLFCNMKSSGMKLFVLSSFFMLLCRWSAAFLYSVGLFPIQDASGTMPFCGYEGIYEILLVGVCLIGSAEKANSFGSLLSGDK